MYHIYVTKKTCFNRTRALKAKALRTLISNAFTDNCSNGNSGVKSSVAYAIREYFANCVVSQTYGDPHTPASLTLDAAKMTQSQWDEVVYWNSVVDGTEVIRWRAMQVVAKANGDFYRSLYRMMSYSADMFIAEMAVRGAALQRGSMWTKDLTYSVFDKDGALVCSAQAEQAMDFVKDNPEGFVFEYANLCRNAQVLEYGRFHAHGTTGQMATF